MTSIYHGGELILDLRGNSAEERDWLIEMLDNRKVEMADREWIVSTDFNEFTGSISIRMEKIAHADERPE